MFDVPRDDFHTGPRVPRWLAADIGVSPDTALHWRSSPRWRDTTAGWLRRVVRGRGADPLDDAVREVPLFSDLSRRRRQLVERFATPMLLPARTVLAEQGTAPREFFIVLDGDLEVRHDDRLVATQGPGSHAGAVFLLGQRRRETSLVAATQLQTLVMSDREFTSVLDGLPEVAERLHAEIGRAAISGFTVEHAA